MSAIDRTSSRWPALIPVGFALATTLYLALRYGYRWAETDTATFVSIARATIAEGTISPTQGAYAHGYGYQTLLAALSEITGLGLAPLQLIVLPFLSLVVALVAFIAFRALTGSALLGAFSALLLFIQPEFLFVIQRGNHEKMTHTLVLMVVFLLTASVTRRQSVSYTSGLIIAFYLGAWAIIATNSFFASSFIASLVISLIGGVLILVLSRASSPEQAVMRRILLTVLASLALFFAFLVYVYAPARHNLGTFQTLIEQLSVLFLSFEPAGNPYAGLSAGPSAAWVTPWVYPLLTAFNWLVLLGSGITWIWLGLTFKRDGVSASNRHLLLLWLFAAAFALQVAVAVIVDITSFLGQNLQIRLFPLFMLFGLPLLVVGLWHLKDRIPRRRRPFAPIALAAVLTFFAFTGVLKATNDPLVSNKWLFFNESEKQALDWSDSALLGRHIWAGTDERLTTMQVIHQPADPARRNIFMIGRATESIRYLTISDVMRLRAPRLGVPLPDVRHEDRIYDNGGAQIYHRVPQTPYQP